MITIFSLVREKIIEIAFWSDSVERFDVWPPDDRNLISEFGSTHEKLDTLHAATTEENNRTRLYGKGRRRSRDQVFPGFSFTVRYR